jgi:hypothetical protein
VLTALAGEGRTFGRTGDADRRWGHVSKALPAWSVNHIMTVGLMTARFVASRG